MIPTRSSVLRMFARETGGARRRNHGGFAAAAGIDGLLCGGGIGSSSGAGFEDFSRRTMSTLQWQEGQCQAVNVDPIPMPIYSLAKGRSAALYVGDEDGFLHVLGDWFDPHPRNLFKRPHHITTISPTGLNIRPAITTVKTVGDRVMIGTGTGQIVVTDATVDRVISHVELHCKSVKKVDSWNGDVIVSCGKDNKICVFDLRLRNLYNPVNVVLNGHSVAECSPRQRKKRKFFLEPGSTSCSISDFVFLDEYRLLSSGASDGRLKEWDLRLSYKQLKKFYPVQVFEYPYESNLRGFSCLQLSGSKLYAATMAHDIFVFDLLKMGYEKTLVSPSKLYSFTKMDSSFDGNFLAVGTETSMVHVFCTRDSGESLKTEGDSDEGSSCKLLPQVKPLVSLNHEAIYSSLPSPQMGVACPIFNPFDDFMLTTGSDFSMLTKWAPAAYLQTSKDLEKEARKQEIEAMAMCS